MKILTRRSWFARGYTPLSRVIMPLLQNQRTEKSAGIAKARLSSSPGFFHEAAGAKGNRVDDAYRPPHVERYSYPTRAGNKLMQPTRYVRPNRRSVVSNRLVWGLLVAFLAAALITSYLTFIVVRDAVAGWLKPVSGPALNAPPPGGKVVMSPEEMNTPLQGSGGPTPAPWDGSSRITILFMGLDYRDWEDGNGPSRTDTMILFTLDPTTQSAGFLSIPRDLWVNIPGYGYSKINTAYFYGEADHVAGGGPALAMQTVQEFIGVPVNYYIQVDFAAFEQFIDEIGGIDVNVPEQIEVDPLGPHNTVVLEPGVQHLDGKTALAYARNRDTAGSDFDRAARQQQVVLAVRDRILNFNMAKLLIEKSPILYQQLSSGVHTNLSLQQIISLGWTASQIQTDNIKHGVIGPDQVTNDWSPDGLQILRPKPEEIRLLRDEIFTSTGPAAQVTATGDPAAMMKDEQATISVLNGTATAGLGAKTTQYLISKGLNVTTTDNAQEAYQYTTVIDYTGKIYTRQYIAQLLNIQPTQVYSRYDPNSPVDIVVILGDDWASSNTLPSK